MIKVANLSRLKVMDFFLVMSNIKDYSEKSDLEALRLKEMFDEQFVVAYQEFDKSLAPTRQKELTDRINDLDKKRVKYFVGLNAHLRALRDYPEKNVADAAIRLKNTIDKFGKKTSSLPLAQKTGVLINVLQELNLGEAKRDVFHTGVLSWVEELEKVNEQFRSLFKERINKEASVEVGKGKNAREQMQKVFTEYTQRINALVVVDGYAPYRTLVENINREIERAMQVKKQSTSMTKGNATSLNTEVNIPE